MSSHTACVNHRHAPEACPREHVCECGAGLHEHLSVEARCPERRGRYKPSPETLRRFPAQYAKAEEVRP